ncbi:MAG: ribose-phosphate pyrophosphokinase [Elusimicrobia bacterium]|jgi:ribose-phosphate pyrophosphokinase|nr:ribose-phosphate pyrophosphokinase [Elusimicrobiota bacterium]MBK7206842.1 ribose-phosphate pyrophosphokinase [Elusimicrobiota bacterium]MBK7545640.1 ribose-phosphate pyrophosphokinase [Elusimicrobiota bacterium]MBK7575170.1 ribose-phosphate pyrophosphokinase [Elusimicrobiota bacterium]MBK7687811.1 ribose-phosphate pyrophosphokinase [Elusimicrobiota bacterium]
MVKKPSDGPAAALKIFSGNAHPALAKEIADVLGTAVGRAHVGRFPDGEVEVKIQENVRGADCFIVQPTSYPANDNLLELLLMVDALRRASAWRITAVLPYFGYGRQDRKAEPRVPISAKLVSNIIRAAGVDRVLTMDLHAGQIQGFFDIPVDHLYANPVLVSYFKKKVAPEEWVVVSPDAGGVERARAFAKRLETGLAIIDKRRLSPNEAAVMHVIGDVRGKKALIIDDLVDTGGTLVKAAQALKDAGAIHVSAAAAHGVLAGPAIDRLNASPVEELVITNSIPLNHKDDRKIKVLSVASLLAEAIQRIHSEQSISEMFI